MRTRPTAAFFAVVYAFAVVMLGTTLPTPLYAIYAGDMGFGGSSGFRVRPVVLLVGRSG